MTKCVICKQKPARIGKKEGYPHNLLCSAKCALNHFLENAMHFEFCNECRQWMACCTCICEEHHALRTYCACPVEGEEEGEGGK